MRVFVKETLSPEVGCDERIDTNDQRQAGQTIDAYDWLTSNLRALLKWCTLIARNKSHNDRIVHTLPSIAINSIFLHCRCLAAEEKGSRILCCLVYASQSPPIDCPATATIFVFGVSWRARERLEGRTVHPKSRYDTTQDTTLQTSCGSALKKDE